MPIDSIEKEIRQAAFCLADITADNPNVWDELGFAFAAGTSVVMVFSEDRQKYPFDLQYRSIIPYLADAPSDFNKLRVNLTAKMDAIVKTDAVLARMAAESQVTLHHGLTPHEILVLAIIAGEAYMPDDATSVDSAKCGAERAGVNNMGFNLVVRRLQQKKFFHEQEVYDDQNGVSYPGLAVTEFGWQWIDANEAQFALLRTEKKQREIPF